MLDINFIRKNIELVRKNIINRRVNVNLDKLLSLDEQRRQIQKEIDELREQRNKGSKEKPTTKEIKQMRILGEKIKIKEAQANKVHAEYNELLLQVPNMTHKESPIGSEKDFVILEINKDKPKFNFVAKDHETLLSERNMIDFERGAKVVGSKFYYTKGNLVRLNQALLNYGMDILEKHGYQLIETPDLAKHEILLGAGFNPRGEEKQIYNIENTDLSLIGTAEITMLGYHANETLDLSKGSIKYGAISHCFRTEAGSYGRTSKGLYRVHQFTKLEMFVFSKPEDSKKLHKELLAIEKEICDGLELPYRVIDIPTGDLGGPAYRKFDMESYMPMLGGYGEITSCSNCTDYQARRLNIKYKNKEGKNEFVHTLNGTAVVLSRFPLALIENFQQKDGSIKIPKKLQGYCGFKKIKK